MANTRKEPLKQFMTTCTLPRVANEEFLAVDFSATERSIFAFTRRVTNGELADFALVRFQFNGLEVTRSAQHEFKEKSSSVTNAKIRGDKFFYCISHIDAEDLFCWPTVIFDKIVMKNLDGTVLDKTTEIDRPLPGYYIIDIHPTGQSQWVCQYSSRFSSGFTDYSYLTSFDKKNQHGNRNRSQELKNEFFLKDQSLQVASLAEDSMLFVNGQRVDVCKMNQMTLPDLAGGMEAFPRFLCQTSAGQVLVAKTQHRIGISPDDKKAQPLEQELQSLGNVIHLAISLPSGNIATFTHKPYTGSHEYQVQLRDKRLKTLSTTLIANADKKTSHPICFMPNHGWNWTGLMSDTQGRVYGDPVTFFHSCNLALAQFDSFPNLLVPLVPAPLARLMQQYLCGTHDRDAAVKYLVCSEAEAKAEQHLKFHLHLNLLKTLLNELGIFPREKQLRQFNDGYEAWLTKTIEALGQVQQELLAFEEQDKDIDTANVMQKITAILTDFIKATAGIERCQKFLANHLVFSKFLKLEEIEKALQALKENCYQEVASRKMLAPK